MFKEKIDRMLTQPFKESGVKRTGYLGLSPIKLSYEPELAK